MKKKFLFSILLLLSSFSSFATHIIGGDLSYECLGNKTYQFTLTIYSECGSTAVLESLYPIRYFSLSQNIPISNPKTFTVNKISEEEVIVFCNNVTTVCSGGTARGIRKVIYKGIINLSGYSSATDWNFYWQKAARSEEITTLAFPDGQDFVINVTMNNVTAACNNSPTFGNSPVIKACKGKVKNFNHIAVDKDGDLLQYTFIAPQNDFGHEVVYKDGYSFTSFMKLKSPATINPTTGDISFTATENEVGITDVLIKEYRNGILIGTVVRGMQITSLDCTNNTPTLSSYTGLNRDSIAVCAGEKVSLKIKASDSDPQNISLKLLKGKENIFTVLNNNTTLPEGDFTWQTNSADAGKYFFTVEAKDDGCPEPQNTTKTYIIQVLSRPAFSLGNDRNVKCDAKVELKPTVTGGDGKYKYLWNTGATTASITVPIGTYSLTVTDGKGCAFTDEINIQSGLNGHFGQTSRCLGQPTQFKDSSTTTNGKITSWAWKFGDGATATIKDPIHSYLQAGTYTVELTIKTDQNCTLTIKNPITICAPPQVKFQNLDSCNNYFNEVNFIDLTPTSADCKVIKRTWEWGDGSSSEYLPPFSNPEYHIYETEGYKNVKLTVTTNAGCTSSGTKKILIHRSPEVQIVENDYIFKCNKPDTLLKTQVDYPGTGELKYFWSTGETTPNIHIDTSGYYFVIITDENGCEVYDQINVSYPLYSSFTFTPFCKIGDAISFNNTSINNTGNPLTYAWDFGDGNPVSTEKNPIHTYSTLGIYNTTLKIKDNINGCLSSFSYPVYNTYFKDTFAIFPKHVSICVNNLVTGVGPDGEAINSYEWDFGNGRSANSRTASTSYSTPGQYILKLKIRYNFQPGMNNGCIKEYQDTITVFPEFKVDFDAFRVCINDPVTLSFRRTAGDLSIGIKNAKWQIKNRKSGKTDISSELKPLYTFEERQTYDVTLTAQDDMGCEYSLTKPFFADVVAKPEFTSNIACSNELTTLTADFKDTYENITNVFWDFGNNDTITKFYARPNIIQKQFNTGGEYPVTIRAYNSFTGCSQSITKTVKVLDLPIVDFEADTVCKLQPMAFTNKTTIASGEIKSWLWEFNDGATSQDQNPSHAYLTAGLHTVKLTALLGTGCSDYKEKEVYVKDIPVADFTIEENLLEVNKPLHFRDNSQGEVTSYIWNFGDGKSSFEKNPVHQYDSIRLYKVTLIVSNALGCMDTIIKKTNLNVRLDLPLAFTPNLDGTNDGLSLIHNCIKELYEFKIYNRWGELVFDGGNNINAVWDGTFRGKEQEVGVYVAYVKALGLYDTKFSFKKNISIIK